MKASHREILGCLGAGLTLLVCLPALAASDYLLEIDDYAGPGKQIAIELQSWSWGASNPTSVGSGGMSSGRLTSPVLRDGQVAVVTAREAGTGVATGKGSCAAGKHFPKATLTNRRQSWILTEVMISACATDGMTLSYKTAQIGSSVTEDAKITKSRSNIQNN